MFHEYLVADMLYVKRGFVVFHCSAEFGLLMKMYKGIVFGVLDSFLLNSLICESIGIFGGIDKKLQKIQRILILLGWLVCWLIYELHMCCIFC